MLLQPGASFSFSVLGSMGNCARTFRTFLSPLSLSMWREDGFDCCNKDLRSFTRDRYSSMFSVMMAINTSSSGRFVKHMPLHLMFICPYKVKSET
ncbi:hypothetical protein CEXT_388011 [Caerostris extrusa]|uniref:Secreted protein n=1 Tax=Caerostris extrusa TaxID=172846 RepID=A0AAV4WAI6_CAEEX|nr:hypothetical protein CEXT_388011 [Caerostris extrusa]